MQEGHHTVPFLFIHDTEKRLKKFAGHTGPFHLDARICQTCYVAHVENSTANAVRPSASLTS